ncbi:MULTISPECIES: hypothetical protein [Methylobacteriaceae]|uniref:hypothetical protein n=1 Tax=Methylobacteriaceae TaxID=119045 RepID=UPI0024E07E9A|nr:hypothetical protein [Methylorubrum aminovorans]
MKRTVAAALPGMQEAAEDPAFILDVHGNVPNFKRTVLNTGAVSGGPTHRNGSRSGGEKVPDGKPAHADNDWHAHGYRHEMPGRR